MFDRLSSWHLVPKTLWGQLVSLLLLALLLSQAVSLAIFIEARRAPDAKQFEQAMMDHIAKVINGIDRSTNQGRPTRDYLADAGTDELTFRAGPTPIRGKDDQPEYTAKMKNNLIAKLDDKTLEIIIISENRRQGSDVKPDQTPQSIKLSLKLLPDFWVKIDRRQATESLEWIAPLLLTMVMMMIFIIIIVSWVVHKITKPLAALANAAQNLGRGREVKEIAETGAEDIRKVTRAFNQMNQKITKFVDDRTRMLAAISHDLRTPITSLRLRAEYVKDEKLQNKMIALIEEMKQLTETALEFSSDSSAYEKTNNVDLTSLLETLVEDYAGMDKDIELIKSAQRKQVILPLRLHSIQRALRNVIDNGLKFGGQVKLDFVADREANFVRIYIRDNGDGIDEVEFEQVFEPFYRLEKSRNKATGGVGLGMSIARGIIQAHGGEIGLTNIKNGDETIGFEVAISLPMD